MRAFFAEFAIPFWFRVADDLNRRYGIIPVAWSGVASMQKDFESRFPQGRFFDLAQIKRNIFPDDLSHLAHGPFDSCCANVWQQWSQLAYDQLHRWDLAGDFTMLERTEHFYAALVFWNAFLVHINPDVIIFRNAPHAFYDLLLLGLAREKKIPTVMFHHTNIIPYSLVSSDIDRGSHPFRAGLTMARWEREAGRKIQEQLKPEVQEKLDSLCKSYESVVPWYQTSSLASLNIGWSLDRVLTLAKQLWKALRRDIKNIPRRKPPNWSPINTGSIAKERRKLLRDSYTGLFSRTSYTWCRIKQRRKILSLREYYSQMATWKEDMQDKPFVYVALSFQPEASSNPHGGIFAQQLLMLNILSNSLPTGWELVVREHPSQFNWDFVGHVCRNEEFYQLISQMPNTHLAPLKLDPFKIMDAAQAVATLIGTSGWEAIVRGTPTLVFGDTWYDHCSGAFRIHDIDECKVALSKVANGALPNAELIKDFLKELEYSGITSGGEMEVCPKEIATTPAEIHRISELMIDVLNLPSRLSTLNLHKLAAD